MGRMRALLFVTLFAAGCAAPWAANERSLRAWLREPVAERELRAAHLRSELDAGDAPRQGVRLAAAHHALRMQQPAPITALLDTEAGAFPGASVFLASYRSLLRAPAPAAAPAARDGSVLLVVLADQTKQRDVIADALATAERPLRELGYYVVPADVAGELLDVLGAEVAPLCAGTADPAALRRLHELGVDACLLFELGRLWIHESLTVESAQFELGYSLYDTATARLRWQRPVFGSYDRRNPVRGYSEPDETFFYPSSLGPGFADQVDFIRALNGGVLSTVPPPARPR